MDEKSFEIKSFQASGNLRIYERKSFGIKIFGALILICSGCVPEDPPPPPATDTAKPSLAPPDKKKEEDKPVVEGKKRRHKRPSSCAAEGADCSEESACEEKCTTLFSKTKDQKKCLNLNTEDVESFEEIFDLLKEGGDFEDLDPKAFKCLLNISSGEFIRRVKKLNPKKTKKFWIAVAEKESLSKALISEDDEHQILERLLYNLGSFNQGALEGLTVDIDNGPLSSLFLEEENEDAFEYLLEYIASACRDDDNDFCVCRSGVSDDFCDNAPRHGINYTGSTKAIRKELTVFCKIYKDKSAGSIRLLIQNSLFQSKYSRFIQRRKACGKGSLANAQGAAPGASPCKMRREDFLNHAVDSGNYLIGSVCRNIAGIIRN